MPSKLSQRIFFFAIAISALICGWLVSRGTSDGPADRAAADVALLDAGEPLEVQEPLGDQELICERLIRSLGGDHAILIRAEDLPMVCGTYARPQGLEFATEKSKSGGSREVTGISIRHPENVNLELWRDTTMREIVKLTSVRTISVISDILRDDDIGQLRQLPELTELGLHDGAISDTALRYIGEMSKLEGLGIYPRSSRLAPVTDNGLMHLANLKQLRAIGLRQMSIRGDVFSSLADLRKVSLYRCDVSRDVFAGLSHCQQLESFHLNGDGELRESDAACLAVLPKLVRVVIMAPMSGDALVALAASRSIEELAIWNHNQYSGQSFAALESLPLTTLDLQCIGIDGGVFAHLARIKSLQTVSVSLTAINDGQIAQIAKMGSLKRLTLSNHSGTKGPILNDSQITWLKSKLPTTEINPP